MTLLVSAHSTAERIISLHGDSALGRNEEGAEIIVPAQRRYVIEISGYDERTDSIGSLGAIELDRPAFMDLLAAGCKHWVDNIIYQGAEVDNEA